jgi:hypothetical protein
MRYIGNFKDWIDEVWLSEIQNARGTARPSEGKKPDSIEEDAEYQRARNAGYKDSDTYFYMFDKNTVSFKLQVPWLTGNSHWWITKMLPGNFMPMHTDPHTLYEPNSKRFWMPWQDWQPGHIFMYENRVITDYKAGDVWEYENSAALHGAANIGFVPRIILQVSSYE